MWSLTLNSSRHSTARARHHGWARRRSGLWLVIILYYDTCWILRSHWLKMPCNLMSLVFHMQSVVCLPSTNVVGREPEESSVTSIVLRNYQTDPCVRSAITQSNPAKMCRLFLTESKTKIGKMRAPQILSKRRKRIKNSAGRKKGWEQTNPKFLRFTSCFQKNFGRLRR